VIFNFLRLVVIPNWWRYLVLIAACFAYAFALSLSGPTWYRAEATLALKNRPDVEHINITRLASNPLPIFLQEIPIEQQYDCSTLVYSTNLADRVIGDRFDELYDPAEFHGPIDFYEKFLLRLGYDYDGEKNIIKLSYIFKDPERAAEFCNGFARALEQFMAEAVERGHISPILRSRLAEARGDAEIAEEEVRRIAALYDVPDLIHAPKEWVRSYGEALTRSMRSEIRVQAALGALRQIRANRERRNLLEEPAGPPDTTIIRDLVLAGLRFRAAMVNALLSVSEEIVPEESSARQRLRAESASLSALLAEQYHLGLDVESTSILMQLQEYLVQNYLYEARAEAIYSRLEELPRLEAEIRPVIREANIANATVFALEKLSSFLEIGESYGVHPIRLIDPAVAPENPIQPAWRTLTYLIPIALFLATLWFALVARMLRETSRMPAGKPAHPAEGRS